ncbi:uncharacterized protein CANTADRAFT_21129 [Suhomyces tanzawaensis NRRL Y-17324]|uniref:Uncharacterized protein n=1 Tax=Suhomyces tanzawaensis NRRL Y-17324 TaxID=984487 RepID=A0A1E4SK05_9ASCO|nr:uncharacterized protein CANTADRAFT_21129 [Suhomyces tanzawaensis NRRL Y-17324]ODV79846.1 hypothetical protein CANTADRAFT_21129 [Suhomyces tanzawaensis NRRL Y-17324]
MSDQPQFGELGKVLTDKLGSNPSQKDIQETIKEGYAKLETLSGNEKDQLAKGLGKLEHLGKLEQLGKLEGGKLEHLGKLEQLGKLEGGKLEGFGKLEGLGKLETKDPKDPKETLEVDGCGKPHETRIIHEIELWADEIA